jgi:cyclopropane fatty-acyl-phospholipid synthase-like methyltransferase
MSAPLPCSAAAERNQGPILEVLRGILPPRGAVLEIASGTGQHVVHFAAALAGLTWQPSDPNRERCATIAARLAAARLPNVLAPLALDVHDEPWPLAAPVDAVLCINMIHIAPASATAALIGGARRWLDPAGARLLFLYGPFKQGGRHTAPSNAAFDESLRAENAAWGVRDLDEVTAAAAAAGFARAAVVPMPANNLSVVFALGAPRASAA